MRNPNIIEQRSAELRIRLNGDFKLAIGRNVSGSVIVVYVSPVMSCWLFQDVPHFSSNDSWGRLQYPCNPFVG